MRIAIMGSGGIGGYLGARLASSGNDVTFIARGSHLDAMQRDGLRLISELGDITVVPVDATGDPVGREPVDLVVFAVKGHDTVDAAELIAPLVGGTTGILNLQNGINGIDVLAERYSQGNVLPGTTMIAAGIETPGVIRHVGTTSAIVLGEWDGSETGRLSAISAALEDAGIEATVSHDIHTAVWSKFVAMATFSALTCLTRLPVRTLAAMSETRELAHESMDEVRSVARARGIEIGEDLKYKLLDFAGQQDPSWKTSMCNDLEAGKRIEISTISGVVHRLGLEFGLPTPIHSFAYRALKHYGSA